MKPQKLVTYVHTSKKLFFVSAVNADRVDTEAKIERQYSRARSLHKGIIEGTVAEHGSGFLYALINSNYTGWEAMIRDTIYDNPAVFLNARQNLINDFLYGGWKNVGSNDARAKGEYGTSSVPYQWNRKFNVFKMTRADINEKINHIFKALDSEVPNSIKNEVYYSIVMPDTHGPLFKNFGAYQVDSLSNIFLYTRNLLGYDL